MAERRVLRIASGQGFWGDDLEAPVRQVEGGPIDYLMMDYLAEVTMSIMQKQRSRDPSAGFALDFVPLMERIFPMCAEKGVRVVTNAGGVNPEGCADALVEAGRSAGVGGRMKVGLVTGDDLMDRLDELMAAGHDLAHMETGAPLSEIRDEVQSANAYIGAGPIVEALAKGADIVVTGRSTDTALTYGPMIHEFGWAADDYDRIASGVVAGHINECGAQCTGGNCLIDWWKIPDMARVGFPIVEAGPDGSFVVTKHPGTGGRVSRASVTEQILYEMGDPTEYITPDVIADFTTIHLEEAGENRVRVHGVKGRAATDFLKVSIAYSSGWKAVGTLTYAWPDAAAKARAADRILRERLDRLGLDFDEVRTELVGWDSTHGALAGEPPPDLPEV
ncbi:MAG TPA: acyclic terpene utilization AtuA family protein, partial [Longimicrobiales bacterium]|nr:acyclic terpene utilization AtuA family protein [Longimicrobiales bacterium]